MSINQIFDVSGSGMQAQSLRLSTIASNLANADSVSSDPEKVYKPREPVFTVIPLGSDRSTAAVGVQKIEESTTPPLKRFEPGHPQADKDGYVYSPAVDPVAQMVNLISASRSFQANVEVMNTTKELMLSTLSMGRG